MRPDVLLLDEPASALDPISTLKIEELIRGLKSQLTLVLVTHNMQQAARVSDYTAFLHGGELVEYAPTDTLFTNPAKKQTQLCAQCGCPQGDSQSHKRSEQPIFDGRGATFIIDEMLP